MTRPTHRGRDEQTGKLIGLEIEKKQSRFPYFHRALNPLPLDQGQAQKIFAYTFAECLVASLTAGQQSV